MIWKNEERSTTRKNVRRNTVKKKATTKRTRRSKAVKTERVGLFARIKNVLFSKWLKTAVVLSVLGGGLYVGGQTAYTLLNKPLENVRLHADLERVTALEVEAVLSKYKQSKFLDLSLPEIQDELRALPWVDRAEVKRKWPNWLLVTLVEQVAVARWGKSGLLNSRGELIMQNAQARYLPPELPQLDGPDGSEWRVAQRYLELHTLLKSHGLYLTHLQQDTRGAWRFTTSNGMQVKLGKHATDARLRRFEESVLPNLLKQERGVSVVDLRYSNGFSVKWQEQDVIAPEIIQEIENQNENENETAVSRKPVRYKQLSQQLILNHESTQVRHYV